MMMQLRVRTLILACLVIIVACGDDDDGGGDPQPDVLELITARMGSQSLLLPDPVVSPVADIVLSFDASIDPGTNSGIRLLDADGANIEVNYANTADDKIITMSPLLPLDEGVKYTLDISSQLKGAQGESYEGRVIEFETSVRNLEIETITSDDMELDPVRPINQKDLRKEVSRSPGKDIQEQEEQDDIPET